MFLFLRDLFDLVNSPIEGVSKFNLTRLQPETGSAHDLEHESISYLLKSAINATNEPTPHLKLPFRAGIVVLLDLPLVRGLKGRS